MSSAHLPSVTVEEAVALLININEVPVGSSVKEVTATAKERAADGYREATGILAEAEAGNQVPSAEAAVGAIFEGFFSIACENVNHARTELAHSLLDAFQKELDRPGPSMLVQVSSTSAVPRFTLDSVNRWATKHFGIRIPGFEVQKQARYFYQSPEIAREAAEPDLPAPDAAATDSDLHKGKKSSETGGLKKSAAEHLYVTLAYLTEMFIDNRAKWLRPNGLINIAKTAETIALHIQADPAAMELFGQGEEAIKTRLEDAQKTKRAKVNRI